MEKVLEQPINSGEKTGKDPITGQFIEGNTFSEGKPKGARHMTTLLLEAIKKVAEGDAEASDVLIVKKLIEKAKAGNDKSMEIVWDRIEGKPQQALDLTSGGEPLKSVDPTDPTILEALKAIQEKLEHDTEN